MSGQYIFFRLFFFIGYVVMLIIAHVTQIASTKFYYLFTVAWAILYLVLAWLFKRSAKIAEQRRITMQAQKLEELKRNAEVIDVDLSKCIIKSNNYTEEIDGVQLGFTSSFNNALANTNVPPYAEQNVAKLARQRSVVVYEHMRNGIKETFISPVLTIDKVSLLFLFDAQKFTKLYIDNRDRRNYHLDLTFLEL